VIKKKKMMDESVRETPAKTLEERVPTLKQSYKKSLEKKLDNFMPNEEDLEMMNSLPLSSEDEEAKTHRGEPIFIDKEHHVST